MTGERVAALGVLAWLLGSLALAVAAWRSYSGTTSYLHSVDTAVGPEGAKELRRGTAATYLIVEMMGEDPVRPDPHTWRLRRFPSHADIGTTKMLSVLRLYEQQLRLRGMLASILPVVGLSIYGIALSLAVGPWLKATSYLWRAETSSRWGAMLLHIAAGFVAVGVPLLAAGAPFLASASVWRYRRRVDMLSERVKEVIVVRIEERRFRE